MTKQELSKLKVGDWVDVSGDTNIKGYIGKSGQVVEVDSASPGRLSVKVQLSRVTLWYEPSSLRLITDKKLFKVGTIVRANLGDCLGKIGCVTGNRGVLWDSPWCWVLFDGKKESIKKYHESLTIMKSNKSEINKPIKENSTMKLTKFQKSIDTSNEAEVAVAETLFNEYGQIDVDKALFGEWFFNKFKADPELIKLALAAVAERDKEDE